MFEFRYYAGGSAEGPFEIVATVNGGGSLNYRGLFISPVVDEAEFVFDSTAEPDLDEDDSPIIHDGGLRPADGLYCLVDIGEPTAPEEPDLTDEQRRARMPELTPRQFRLGLIASGIMPDAIDALIAAIPDAGERAIAQVEWEFALSFQRLHYFVVMLSALIPLTPEQVDDMWLAAVEL